MPTGQDLGDITYTYTTGTGNVYRWTGELPTITADDIVPATITIDAGEITIDAGDANIGTDTPLNGYTVIGHQDETRWSPDTGLWINTHDEEIKDLKEEIEHLKADNKRLMEMFDKLTAKEWSELQETEDANSSNDRQNGAE